MKFPEDMNQLAHDMEDAIRDAKEHVILSVEKYSFQIALALMSITTAVLVFGTIYVWCFHRAPHHEKVEEKESKVEEEEKEVKETVKKSVKSPSRIPARQTSRPNEVTDESFDRQDSSAAEECQDEAPLVARQQSKDVDVEEVESFLNTEVSEKVSMNGNLKLNTEAASKIDTAGQDSSSPQEAPKSPFLKSTSPSNTQTDDVRRRKVSSSNNNNESPVKSKIPVRLQSH